MLLTIIVCIIIFIGSAYAIMAYNNDVSTTEIFEQIYKMSGADNYADYNVIEIAYAVGLFSGIAVFYDHFMGRKLSKAPTPIEVAMNQYVKDETQTLIDSSYEMPRHVKDLMKVLENADIKDSRSYSSRSCCRACHSNRTFCAYIKHRSDNRYADVTDTKEH